MGNPAFTRKEGAGIEMWRYDGVACKAFFFLYPQGSGLSVRHVETMPRPIRCGGGCRLPQSVARGREGRDILIGVLSGTGSFVLSLKRHRSFSTQVGQSGLRATQV